MAKNNEIANMSAQDIIDKIEIELNRIFENVAQISRKPLMLSRTKRGIPSFHLQGNGNKINPLFNRLEGHLGYRRSGMQQGDLSVYHLDIPEIEKSFHTGAIDMLRKLRSFTP